jgi:hypothetical protein
MSEATDIFDAAFSRPRDARSRPYKYGVLAALRFRMREITEIPFPYEAGSAEADAYFSGLDEGHSLAREYFANAAVDATTANA